MAYMLITVCEREISTQKFDTLDDCQNAMENELYEVVDIDDDEYELDDFSAWADGYGGQNFDWKIVEI